MSALPCGATTPSRVLHSGTKHAAFSSVTVLEWPWRDVVIMNRGHGRHAVSKQDTSQQSTPEATLPHEMPLDMDLDCCGCQSPLLTLQHC